MKGNAYIKLAAEDFIHAVDSGRKGMNSGKSVLIIEDVLPLKEYLCASLKADGFRVQCCDDAASALAAASKKDFHIIITDYRLPHMNGAEATRILRMRFPLAIIIGVSSDDRKDDFLSAGANAFLPKPYIYNDLVKLISSSPL